MTSEMIRERGLEVLRRELGRAGLALFLQQFSRGSGDYTVDRQEYLKDFKLEDLKGHIDAKNKHRKPSGKRATRRAVAKAK